LPNGIKYPHRADKWHINAHCLSCMLLWFKSLKVLQ
jgi:hypothetical protein